MGTILLYYKYVHIQYPGRVRKWQQKICKELGLTGRILIGREGINGTVGGSDISTQRYIEAMRQNDYFSDVEFKTAVGAAECFPRLQVLVKNEIVHLGLDQEGCSVRDSAQHLTPAEWHARLENPSDDQVILDTRNRYETCVGTFTGSIIPDIQNFRNFPDYIDHNLDLFRDKVVLMFCTGGVRCERASAYPKLREVAKAVYQLEGGIHCYVEQFPDGFFRGKNYVFDRRITVRVTDDVLAYCAICSASCDDYQNCVNLLCNKHFISCAECTKRFENTCGDTCHQLVTTGQVPVRPEPLRPWRPEDSASCKVG